MATLLTPCHKIRAWQLAGWHLFSLPPIQQELSELNAETLNVFLWLISPG